MDEKQKQLELFWQFRNSPHTLASHEASVQTPLSQAPEGHTVPQAPQLFGSLEISPVQLDAKEDVVDVALV